MSGARPMLMNGISARDSGSVRGNPWYPLFVGGPVGQGVTTKGLGEVVPMADRKHYVCSRMGCLSSYEDGQSTGRPSRRAPASSGRPTAGGGRGHNFTGFSRSGSRVRLRFTDGRGLSPRRQLCQAWSTAPERRGQKGKPARHHWTCCFRSAASVRRSPIGLLADAPRRLRPGAGTKKSA